MSTKIKFVIRLSLLQIYKMRASFLCVLIIFLFTIRLFGQDTTISKLPATIFIYNEDDSPFALDFGGGFGMDDVGVKFGGSVNLDVYHILLGFNFSITGNQSFVAGEHIDVSSLLLGYRYRTEQVMIALSSGYAWQRFKCKESDRYNCDDYLKATIHAIPFDLQADYILSDYFAIGVRLNYLASSRRSITGFLLGFKLGALRNNY